MIPTLTRTLDPGDYLHLAEELGIVDQVGLPGQHPHRRWEYALALHAVGRWFAAFGHYQIGPVYDVGGGGSTFHHMLATWTGHLVEIIDPTTPNGLTLAEWLRRDGTRPKGDVVTAISVVEHVPDLDGFVEDLARLTAVGGVVILTMDYWNRCGPDTAVNKDLRVRIFCPKTHARLIKRCQQAGLHPFGGIDLSWHGAHVHDYTFASLVMQRRG